MSKECAEKARKPDEIEITPEMIEAGRAVLVEAYDDVSDLALSPELSFAAHVAVEVFLAMFHLKNN